VSSKCNRTKVNRRAAISRCGCEAHGGFGSSDHSLHARGKDHLLREVVMAVVESGHASDLNDLPHVLAHFGACLPEPRTEGSGAHPVLRSMAGVQCDDDAIGGDG
jgi:hypothetical protein